MTAALPKACAIGHPVAHSRSPMIHGYWLRTLGIRAYELKDLTPEAFPDFVTHLAANGYVGGNVTVPHKEAAFRLVDERDSASEAVGAVNTLWLEGGQAEGRELGHARLHREPRRPRARLGCAGGRAVILGAGGAARSAAYALATRGLEGAVATARSRARTASAADFGRA